jgi:RimJ/RimL family protein N-acetyltransferase
MTEHPGPRGPSGERGRHIRIVQLDAATLAALADGDLEAANRTSPVALTPYFVDAGGPRLWRLRADQVVTDPSSQAWITGVIWDVERQVAVGRAGFHGPPDDAGMVEVGYAVDPAYRRKGYARAALEALLERAAREPEVRVVRATISPGNNASRSLVEKYGFVENGEQWDDEDGLEIIFDVGAEGLRAGVRSLE